MLATKPVHKNRHFKRSIPEHSHTFGDLKRRHKATEFPNSAVLLKIEAELKDLFEQLKGYDFANVCPGDKIIWKTVESLRALVRAPKNQPFCKELLQRNREIIPALRKLYGNYIVSLERCIAERCTLEERASMAREYVLSSEKLAVGEVNVSNLDQSSSIIFVGSGPLPVSALSYARACTAKITALDVDPVAVQLSRKLVEELPEYRGLIDIVEGDATTFDFSPYTHIAIAVMAQPKDRIFAQIAKTAQRDVTVICRTANALAEFVYEPVKPSCYPGFNEIARYVGPHFVQSKVLKMN